MLQMPAYELGKKEKEMMEPKRIEDKNEKLYKFDFKKFDNQLNKAIEILYPEDAAECKAYIMLAAKHDETYPMGVILFKTPEYNIEKEALKAHLRNLIEDLDE